MALLVVFRVCVPGCVVVFFANAHLSQLSLSPEASLSLVTALMCCMCSFLLLECMTISPANVSQYFSLCSCSASLKACWHIFVAFFLKSACHYLELIQPYWSGECCLMFIFIFNW